MAKKAKRATLKELLQLLAAEFIKHGSQSEDERLDFYKAKHSGKKLVDLAFVQADAQLVIDYLSELRKRAQAEFDALRLQLIPAKMEEEGLENMTIEDLGRLGLTGDMYVSIKEGKKEEFFAWLNKRRLGDLIQDTVNPSTLKSFVKSRMDAGKDVPGELLNVTPYTRASITRV